MQKLQTSIHVYIFHPGTIVRRSLHHDFDISR